MERAQSTGQCVYTAVEDKTRQQGQIEETDMGEAATDNQFPVGTTAATTAADNTGAETLDVAYALGESPATVGTPEGKTAREVAAQHFARLMYSPVNSWSRYVFHENEPHPFGPSRQ